MAEIASSIWLVISGDYDSYSVEGAFSSEELADELAQKINAAYPDSEASAEEWALDQRRDDLLMYRIAYAQPLGAKQDSEPQLNRMEPLIASMKDVWNSTTFQRPGSKHGQGIGYGHSYEEAEANLWAAIDRYKASTQ